jgi:hypothetical protein
VSPQEDPIQVAMKAYHSARAQGQFAEAAAQRELARTLLDQVPADSQFGTSFWNVARLYQGSGLSAQALAIAQQALARATALDTRIQLLQMIADFYQQDGNFLQAVPYREKLLAALDEAAAQPQKPNGGIASSRVVSFSGPGRFLDRRTAAYGQLADLYQQLGRPDAVAATVKRMIAIAKDPRSTAEFYQQHGQLDEAAAIYKKQAEQADPSVQAGALESLANIYHQEQRYADAADALRQAIAVVNASGKPELQQQNVWNRTVLAGALNLAGDTSGADQVYEQLLAEAGIAPEGNYLQVLTNYANYLASTKRDAKGQALLSDYLTSHSNLPPQVEANLLYQLSDGASRSGDSKLAEQYRQAAQEKQRASQPAFVPAPQILIGPDLQAAETAVNAGKLDQAFELGLQAIANAPRAADREQIAWQLPNLATQFANKKQSEKAEQLYERLFPAVEAWSVDSPQALINTLQNYVQFVISQDGRWNQAPGALKRLRDAIVTAQGPASSSLWAALGLKAELERRRGTPAGAIAAVQEMLAFEESRSGNTSEKYLSGAEVLAHEYQSNGDPGNALPIFRRNAEIADLACRPSDIRRAHVRITAAMALAQQKQFDEAEKLATEAIAIGKAMRPPQSDWFTDQLEQIRKMRIQQTRLPPP